MSKANIYQFDIYDIKTDSMVPSGKWGTLDGIKGLNVGHKIHENTITEIDQSVIINWKIPGVSERGFDPRRA